MLFSVTVIGRSMSFPKALDACARINATLPNADTEEKRQNLIARIKNNKNLTNVWLSLYMHDLEKHQVVPLHFI